MLFRRHACLWAGDNKNLEKRGILCRIFGRWAYRQGRADGDSKGNIAGFGRHNRCHGLWWQRPDLSGQSVQATQGIRLYRPVYRWNHRKIWTYRLLFYNVPASPVAFGQCKSTRWRNQSRQTASRHIHADICNRVDYRCSYMVATCKEKIRP